jgi:hypothetical protein
MRMQQTVCGTLLLRTAANKQQVESSKRLLTYLGSEMIKILGMLNTLSLFSYSMTVALKNNYPHINFFNT